MPRFPIQGPVSQNPVPQNWGGYQATPEREQIDADPFAGFHPDLLEAIGDLVLRQASGEQISSYQPRLNQMGGEPRGVRKATQQSIDSRGQRPEHPVMQMLRSQIRSAPNEQGQGFGMPTQTPPYHTYQAPRVAGMSQLPAPSMPQHMPQPPQPAQREFVPLTATTGPYQAMNLAQASPQIPGYMYGRS